eukprot:356917-Chlamydomonas_euryale.AAC.13
MNTCHAHTSLSTTTTTFFQASREGDANAMLRLSKMYLHGQGCEKNVEMAHEWLRKARCVVPLLYVLPAAFTLPTLSSSSVPKEHRYGAYVAVQSAVGHGPPSPFNPPSNTRTPSIPARMVHGLEHHPTHKPERPRTFLPTLSLACMVCTPHLRSSMPDPQPPTHP